MKLIYLIILTLLSLSCSSNFAQYSDFFSQGHQKSKISHGFYIIDGLLPNPKNRICSAHRDSEDTVLKRFHEQISSKLAVSYYTRPTRIDSLMLWSKTGNRIAGKAAKQICEDLRSQRVNRVHLLGYSMGGTLLSRVIEKLEQSCRQEATAAIAKGKATFVDSVRHAYVEMPSLRRASLSIPSYVRGRHYIAKNRKGLLTNGPCDVPHIGVKGKNIEAENRSEEDHHITLGHSDKLLIDIADRYLDDLFENRSDSKIVERKHKHIPTQEDLFLKEIKKNIKLLPEGLLSQKQEAIAEKIISDYHTPIRDYYTTGFFLSGDYKDPILERAKKKLRSTNGKIQVALVEADITNLGGLAHGLGHSKANRTYGKMANIFSRSLTKYALLNSSQAFFIKHGGDEFCAVIIGENLKWIATALSEANTTTNHFIQKEGLQSIPHTKPGNPPGTGLNFAFKLMSPDDDVAQFKEEVDSQIEVNKKRRKQNHGEPGSQSPIVKKEDDSREYIPLDSYLEKFRYKNIRSKDKLDHPIDGPDEARKKVFSEALRNEGMTDETAMDKLYPRLPRDEYTTKFYMGGELDSHLFRILNTVLKESIPSFLIQCDLRNLNGINSFKGGAYHGNLVYRQAARIVWQHIKGKLGTHWEAFKHGGDEFAFTVANVAKSSLKQAYDSVEETLKVAEQSVHEYIKAEGLDQIVHPKHKEDPRKKGSGVICTSVPLLVYSLDDRDNSGGFQDAINELKGILDVNLEVLKNNYVNPDYEAP